MIVGAHVLAVNMRRWRLFFLLFGRVVVGPGNAPLSVRGTALSSGPNRPSYWGYSIRKLAVDGNIRASVLSLVVVLCRISPRHGVGGRALKGRGAGHHRVVDAARCYFQRRATAAAPPLRNS